MLASFPQAYFMPVVGSVNSAVHKNVRKSFDHWRDIGYYADMESKKEKAGGDNRGANQKGKAKHRSPNYPVIGLRKAVERATELNAQFHRHLVPIGVAHEHWGYKANSGVGNQVVSALRAFGLIDVQGEGEKRQIRLSDAGFKIVENHKDRADLLKSAAMGPTLYAEIWKAYGQDGLPPDDVLRHYLKFDRNFNPDAIETVIGQFRDSIAFSNLSASDTIGEAGQSDDDSTEDEVMVVDVAPEKEAVGKQKHRHVERGDDWAGPKMVLDLPRGNRIEIRLLSKVSPEEFKKIQKIYDLSELSFVDSDDGRDEAE